MKKIGLIVLLILAAMLSNGWAQQTAEESPTSIPLPATQGLTPEQFFQVLQTAWQNNDTQQAEQLVTNHPSTAGQGYQVLLKLGQGEGENAKTFRALASFLEQFPIVKTLAQAEQLNQQVIELYPQGKYTEAIPLAEQTLALREKVLGPDHPNTLQSLNNLAMLYLYMGAYAQAEPLLQRALAIQEKGLGPEHLDTATSLNNLALLYQAMGNYAKAEPLFQRAMAIWEKSLGKEHPNVATSLNNLAELYRAMGNYAKAEPLYQRALAIDEQALGPEHSDVATDLNNLALLYQGMGAYAQAEPLLQQALVIWEKTLGSEHPSTATSLNNLALLYRNMGAYAQAEPLYQRALAIQEKVLGPDHPDTANSLNNLADLYHAMGDYAKAEPLYQRALAIWEKSLGKEHPNVATSLNNLARLYDNMGAYAQAEPLYQRALTIREKALRPEHPDVAASLNNLAILYNNMGAYAQAGPLLQQALVIWEKTLGSEHPSTAASLNNLALLYDNRGAYAQAEPLYQRALAIAEKALGSEHPSTAASLNNLALLYDNRGAYAQAEPLYQRALAIREKALGADHPDVADSLHNLAKLYATLGKFDQAHALHKSAQQIHTQLIEQMMGFTSETQKLDFLATVKWELYAFLSLVSQQLAQNAAARKDGLNVWLRRKGVILETQKQFQEALLGSDDPDVRSTFDELSQVRFQLSQLTFAGPGKRSPEVYQQQLADLKAQKEQLEAKLSRLSAAFATSRKVAKVDVTAVANALPAKTALVEFARIDLFNFKAKGKEEKWQPAHYLAFILFAGNGEDVRLIDLGDAATIDQAITTFKQAIRQKESDRTGATTKAGQQLYQLVFAPLQKELGEVKEIFISPDGNLNLLPFEVLVGPDGRFLIETYAFDYLSAGRDLLAFGTIKDQGNPPLLIGDPDFDLEPTPNPSQADSGLTGNLPTYSPLRQAQDIASPEGKERSGEMKGFHFDRLPKAQIEVEEIQTILDDPDSAIYTDKAARESVLRAHPTPRILHLATHGFFLEDQDLRDFAIPKATEGREVADFSRDPNAKNLRPFSQFENPLVRSGVVLAGANNALGNERQSEGIVTAEKILGLKLRGTDVVVLSACETGLGEVQAGEGVFGLRRAFTQAGTKSLVMSLWSVPDKETKELMVQFYQNLLSSSMNRQQALRQAALRQMQVVKKRYGAAYPYYWGAFVFLGEP